MNLLPFNPFDLHVIWYQAWRGHIKNAKQDPAMRDGYCRAAMIAQGKYVEELALKIARLPK
jgi:hypothetical protein